MSRKLAVICFMCLLLFGVNHATVYAEEPHGPPIYYLSLGTSLAAGVQADPSTGEDISTETGYPRLLADNLLEPLLGISDPRRDSRIDFVGGIRGLEELERRVDSGEMQLAFSLYPTGMEDLMAVADAGEVMPPKSTWFEPKLADGLVSHMLD